MKKIVMIWMTLFICIILLCSCSGHNPKQTIEGKTFVYEGQGFGGDFTISIKTDGTFSYYEGPLSSFKGMGTWQIDGAMLCLYVPSNNDPDYQRFYFRVDGNDLVFIQEKSNNFTYVKLSDGEKFYVRR